MTNIMLHKNIDELAQDCVISMGDIFWDFTESRDSPLEFSNPFQVAVGAVTATLNELIQSGGAHHIDRSPLSTNPAGIDSESRGSRDALDGFVDIVTEAKLSQIDEDEVVALARRYGAGLLRHALALAESLGLEERGIAQ